MTCRWSRRKGERTEDAAERENGQFRPREGLTVWEERVKEDRNIPAPRKNYKRTDHTCRESGFEGEGAEKWRGGRKGRRGRGGKQGSASDREIEQENKERGRWKSEDEAEDAIELTRLGRQVERAWGEAS